MNISGTALEAEFDRAWCEWPDIHHAAGQHDLPHRLIWAVGSRETNLTDEVGDGGHGHGIFQLDDRSHTIPAPFPVKEQAHTAAGMLVGLIAEFADDKRLSEPDRLRAALAAYNSGSGNVQSAIRAGLDVDYYTTGRDYGADVIERMHYLRGVPDPVCGKAKPPKGGGVTKTPTKAAPKPVKKSAPKLTPAQRTAAARKAAAAKTTPPPRKPVKK